MRCLIIGTSNSILASGYRPFLEALLPEATFGLFMIGATPSILVPYALATRPPDDVDTVVIDTLVNDANHAAAGWASDAWNFRMLQESADHLRGLGKRVVLLLMPQTESADVARRLRRERKAFARDRGIEVLDGYDVTDALQATCDLSEGQVFKDPAHVHPPAALIIAQRLAALLRRDPPPDRIEAPEAASRALPYLFRPMPAAPGGPVLRSTALLQRGYVALKAGERREIDFGRPVALLGVALNLAATSCLLVVRGEHGGIVKDLRFAGGPAGADAMQHQLVAFADPPRGTTFTIEVRASVGSEAIEASRLAGQAVSAGEAEVEGFVARVLHPAPPSLFQAAADAEAAVPALSAEERCIGRLAGLMPTTDRLERAAGIFRGRIASTVPIWRRQPPQAALALASLGVELGAVRAARHVLEEALREAPQARRVAERLAALKDPAE